MATSDLTSALLAQLPPDFLDHLSAFESGGDPDAKNPGSTASGAYQLTDGTRGYLTGRYGNHTDPELASMYGLENKATLEPVLGHPVENDELGLAHMFG